MDNIKSRCKFKTCRYIKNLSCKFRRCEDNKILQCKIRTRTKEIYERNKRKRNRHGEREKRIRTRSKCSFRAIAQAKARLGRKRNIRKNCARERTKRWKKEHCVRRIFRKDEKGYRTRKRHSKLSTQRRKQYKNEYNEPMERHGEHIA